MVLSLALPRPQSAVATDVAFPADASVNEPAGDEKNIDARNLHSHRHHHQHGGGTLPETILKFRLTVVLQYLLIYFKVYTVA